MFASNQKLLITGDLKHSGDLEDALNFVLNKQYDKTLNPMYKNPDAFQITADGRYVLGRVYKKEVEGWTLYPFDANIEILTPIIRQHLLKQKFPTECDGDGSYSNGFLISNDDCHCSFSDRNGIINSFNAIITIKPYTCYYSK